MCLATAIHTLKWLKIIIVQVTIEKNIASAKPLMLAFKLWQNIHTHMCFLFLLIQHNYNIIFLAS